MSDRYFSGYKTGATNVDSIESIPREFHFQSWQGAA